MDPQVFENKVNNFRLMAIICTVIGLPGIQRFYISHFAYGSLQMVFSMWVAIFFLTILGVVTVGFYIIYPIIFSVFVTVYSILAAFVIGLILTPCLILAICLFFVPVIFIFIFPCLLVIGVPGFVLGVLDAIYADRIIAQKYGVDPIQMKLLIKDLRAGKLNKAKAQTSPMPSNQNPNYPNYGYPPAPQYQQQQQFPQQQQPQYNMYAPPQFQQPQQQQYYPQQPQQPQYYPQQNGGRMEEPQQQQPQQKAYPAPKQETNTFTGTEGTPFN